MNNIVTADMTEVESQAFIDTALEKTLPVLAQIAKGRRVSHLADLPIDIEKLNAAILNSTMLVFPPGMKRRNRNIVKRTYLFADVTAQIAFPDDKDRVQRWEHMLKGMKAMGWTSFSKAHINYEETSSGLTMSNLVLDIVQAVIGGVTGGVGVALKAGAEVALAGLKGNKEALALYESNGKKGDGANFGVGSIAQDEEGDVYLALGGVSYFASSGNTKIVFFDKTQSSGTIYQSKAAFTIYEDDYTPKKEAAANAFYEALDAAAELEFGI